MERSLLATPHRYNPPTLVDISEAEQDQDIKLGSITVQEVIDAANKLKNGIIPDDDNVCKDGESRRTVNATAFATHPLGHLGQLSDNRCLEEGNNRQTPMKGNLFECNNRRGITLLSITSKVFRLILL